uniref:Uncharacterized protein n=1 Tax=Megaselia scalaris TaxID=36166 RepID=T1GAF8_MEGSC
MPLPSTSKQHKTVMTSSSIDSNSNENTQIEDPNATAADDKFQLSGGHMNILKMCKTNTSAYSAMVDSVYEIELHNLEAGSEESDLTRMFVSDDDGDDD